jgi:hypothetical protein
MIRFLDLDEDDYEGKLTDRVNERSFGNEKLITRKRIDVCETIEE